MPKFTIEWNDVRTVWSEVEAKTDKDAIKKLMEGKGKEINWSGSDTPDSEKDIQKVTEESKQ